MILALTVWHFSPSQPGLFMSGLVWSVWLSRCRQLSTRTALPNLLESHVLSLLLSDSTIAWLVRSHNPPITIPPPVQTSLYVCGSVVCFLPFTYEVMVAHHQRCRLWLLHSFHPITPYIPFIPYILVHTYHTCSYIVPTAPCLSTANTLPGYSILISCLSATSSNSDPRSFGQHSHKHPLLTHPFLRISREYIAAFTFWHNKQSHGRLHWIWFRQIFDVVLLTRSQSHLPSINDYLIRSFH